jgi:hypothetical protein
MIEKDLEISEVKQAKDNIKDLKVYGDGDTFRLLCKATSQEQGWMKSTKVCNVVGGCIVQVTTQQRNPDGSYSVAEALTYVPGCRINYEVEPRRIESISGRESR